MMKAGLIDEMMSEAIDDAIGAEDEEEETEAEVQRVLNEIAGETLASLPAAQVRPRGAGGERHCVLGERPRVSHAHVPLQTSGRRARVCKRVGMGCVWGQGGEGAARARLVIMAASGMHGFGTNRCSTEQQKREPSLPWHAAMQPVWRVRGRGFRLGKGAYPSDQPWLEVQGRVPQHSSPFTSPTHPHPVSARVPAAR